MVATYTLSGLGYRRAWAPSGRMKIGAGGAGRSVAGPKCSTIALPATLVVGSGQGGTTVRVPSAPTTVTSGSPAPPVGSSSSVGT